MKMQWGIGFKIPYEDEPLLVNFPEPTVRDRYRDMNGESKYVTIKYLFRFPPQGWKEMQRLASIKVEMQKLISSIIFLEEDVSLSVSDDDEIGKIYTISELGRFFRGFIRYPKPWYPHEKDEYMSRLAIYAKTLYREGLFHFESVLAMAMHFNHLIGRPYNHREVMKKSLSIMKLDRSGWRRKLDKDELENALSQGGKMRGAQVGEEAYQRMMTLFWLLPEYVTDRGTYDIKGLMAATGFSKSTIYNFIAKLRESGKLEC